MNLAPNGKPSNLTPEQYKIVRTPAFKAWFGDWENDAENSSKVVDENGEPLICYHGSNKKFYVFEPSKEGFNKKTIRMGGNAIYFSNKERVARMFTDNYGEGYVYPCFLLFKNPIFLDAEGGEISYLNQELKKIPNTKDIIVKNTIDVLDMYKGQYQKDYISDIYITSNPKNIKLADKLFKPIWTESGMSKLKTIGKINTTFDSNNPDIRYKNGGLTMKKPKQLLAPNGKPSNLTPEQYRLVRTPEFKAWFGDWENSPETASRVVDYNGEPLVVYHGTRSDDFYEFENKLFGYRGFYFTDKKSVARNYGSNIRQFFLNSKNFVSEDMKGGNYSDNEWIDDLVENSEMDNKDVHLLNFIDPLDPSSMERFPISNIYIIFNKSNIKLADGTNTTFDSNNPDIRYKNGGIVTEKTEILYHGTSLNRANKILKDGFDLERQSDKTKQGHKKAISFTSSYQEAKEHSDWAAEKFNDKPAIISITIPFEILSGKSFFDMNMDIEKAYKLFELKKIDGVSFCDYQTGDGCEEMEVAIFNIEKLNKNKLNFSIEYSSGGEINSEILSSQEVEDKLGRKLHWWNDNVVTINGTEYKKVFLKPEYKRL